MTLKSSGLTATQSVDRISVLDGWRTLSVLLVVISHLSLQSSIGFSPDSSPLARTLYVPLLEGLGYVGVNVFFVISGFVICRGFIRENVRFKRISLSAFYVRRVFRIFPPLVLYVATVSLLAVFAIVGQDATGVMRALTFTCNFPGADCGGWLGGHTWSLSVEEQFYLVIPLLFAALGGKRAAVLTALAFLLPALVVALYLASYSAASRFLADFCGIAIGVACALNERRIVKLVSLSPGWMLYLGLVLLPVFARLYNTRTWPVVIPALGFLIAFLLLRTVATRSTVTKYLTMPPILAMGRSSYGLYLWQQLALNPFPGAGISFYIASMAGCLALVFASYLWLELPLIGTGSQISRRLQGETPVSTSQAARV
jgi:peptidoglycan/LPS O-acetylase OafA/YrhL